jgi:hypothetical protein
VRRHGAGARVFLRVGLSGASTASLSTALAAAELLGSQRFESVVSCASSTTQSGDRPTLSSCTANTPAQHVARCAREKNDSDAVNR